MQQDSVFQRYKFLKPAIIGAIILIVALILNPLYTVGSTERALVFRFGAVRSSIVQPGIHIRMPFIDSVKTLPVQPFQIKETIGVGRGGAISQDNQTVGAETTTFYKYKADDLINMYTNFGTDKIKALVESASVESIKATIGKYTIFQVASNQEKIQAECFALLREKTSNLPVTITELRIMNWDWSDDFDKQIAETMKAAQEVKKKEQELQVTQNEAQKQVKEAEAQKQTTVLRAEAELEAAKLKAAARIAEGEGIRVYNEKIAQNLNVQIRLKELDNERARIDKWNGEYVANNNYGPIPVSTGTVKGQ
jgi:regulator of protease activity HflC (stomatin/prohibitin superfamily)